MEASERQRSEADERAFFARYYAEQRYHPVGWRLRMERDLRVLLEATKAHAPVAGASAPETGPKAHPPVAGASAPKTGTEPRPGTGRTLSIGCGDGAFELLLAAHAESVVAVDLSPEAIAVAKRAQAQSGVANVEFRCASFRDLPWSEKFDTIVCLAFLHHVPEAELPGFLRDCREHLVPGGVFFSQDPNVRGVLRAIGRVVMGKGYDAYHSPDERELDPAALSEQLRAAGLEDVAIRHVDLTLIPACYVIRRGPGLPLRLLAWLDRAFCATPLAPFSSGFAAIARRAS